jgi:hypothetical protein
VCEQKAIFNELSYQTVDFFAILFYRVPACHDRDKSLTKMVSVSGFQMPGLLSDK